MRKLLVISSFMGFLCITLALVINNNINLNGSITTTLMNRNNLTIALNNGEGNAVKVNDSDDVDNGSGDFDGGRNGVDRIDGRILDASSKTGLFDEVAIREALVTSNDHTRNLILKQTLKSENRQFFGLILIPYIICFFAAKGFWPFYPAILQYQVNEMGKKVFSLSDDRLRQFCRGKFNFQETCYRPVYYKGYFVPLPDVPTPEDCVPVSKPTATTTTKPAEPAAQSWGDAPARIAAEKPSRRKPSKVAPQKNSDAEVFDTTTSTTTTTTIPPPPVRTQERPKGQALENLDGSDKQQPNINIEIHNIFSFGGSDNGETGNPNKNPNGVNIERGRGEVDREDNNEKNTTKEVK